MHAIEAEAHTLRRAVARHDYAGAEAAALRYSRLVESALPSLETVAGTRLLDDSCRLLEWARRELCACRTRVAQRLTHLESAARYCAAPPSPPTWKITV